MHNGKQVHNHLVSQDGTHGDKPSSLHKKLIADHVTAAKKHLDKMAGHIFSDEDDEDDMDESVTQKIDLGSLFEGEEFTEEFKTKAADLFEAAVEARTKQEVARIEEELSQRSLDESVELKEGLVDKVDGYLDYVVEQWMQKNELALDRGIKIEIFESFVSGMKDLFETHYIDVPEEKFDLMESVDAKAKTLEEQVDFLTAQNVELQQKFKLVAKERQIEEACKELTDLEAERFKQLAEELAYDDEESFGKKLELVKENYISKAKPVKTVVDSVVTDSPVGLNEDKQVDASMARYMNAFKAR
jgi:AcrR family transcriptional regulator